MALATAISVAMTLYLKWFLRIWHDGGFPFATTVTCVSMFFQWFVSIAISTATKTTYPRLTRKAYWTLAVPIGLCTSLDFLCSNLALLYISVTLFTMVKAASHVWTLLFSIWLGHQRASLPLAVVVVLICVGIALSSYGATTFNLTGFLLVISASVCGTLRWVLTQSLLREIKETPNQILAVVHYTSPASALGLLPVAIAYDGKKLLASKFAMDAELLFQAIGFVVVCAVFALALVVVKILLVRETSALTLGICGSVRDTAQILLAVALLGETLVPINCAGLGVAIAGTLLYAYLKHRDGIIKVAVAERDDTDGSEDDLELGKMAVDTAQPETHTYTSIETPRPCRLG